MKKMSFRKKCELIRDLRDFIYKNECIQRESPKCHWEISYNNDITVIFEHDGIIMISIKGERDRHLLDKWWFKRESGDKIEILEEIVEGLILK